MFLGYTDAEYISVEHAARILRLNPHSIYRALRRGEVPAVRVGIYYRIPVTYLGFKPRRKNPQPFEAIGQLEFDYDVPIHPVRLWRNTGRPVQRYTYDNREKGFG